MGSATGAITIADERLFGDPAEWPDQDLVSWSEYVDYPLALLAYAEGVFPMPFDIPGHEKVMGWWSPVDRGILELENFRVTRSLRKSAKRYRTTIDRAFSDVLQRCGDPSREFGWIDDDIIAVVMDLHHRGMAHSVETWDADGNLVGGLYGISLGGLFAGESMFHDPERGRDASKVALGRLVNELRRRPDRQGLLDVQWATPHLESLGVTEITRDEYLRRVRVAVQGPETTWSMLTRPGEWGL